MDYVAQGKPLRDRNFNKELVGHAMVIYFYYHFLKQYLFVFFLSLFLALHMRNVSGKGENSKILRVKVSHLDCLESPKQKRANNRSKAEKLGNSWLGKQKMLISCGNPQASVPEHCATMQELVAAAVKSQCSEKAQANVLASLWRLFIEADKADIAQGRSAAEQEL